MTSPSTPAAFTPSRFESAYVDARGSEGLPATPSTSFPSALVPPALADATAPTGNIYPAVLAVSVGAFYLSDRHAAQTASAAQISKIPSPAISGSMGVSRD